MSSRDSYQPKDLLRLGLARMQKRLYRIPERVFLIGQILYRLHEE